MLPEFRCDVHHEGPGRTRVIVTGELDMASAAELKTVLQGAVSAEGAERVIVDLGGVGFLDSSGLGALVAASRTSREIGVVLELANPSDPVHRTIVFSGLESHLLSA